MGKNLVLDVYTGHASRLERTHGVHGVYRLAVPGVSVADYRQGHRLHHPLGHRKLLGHGHQRLAHGQMGPGNIAAAIYGLEAQRLHQPRRDRVVSAGGNDLLPRLKPGSEVAPY